eukprot:83629-Pyramimonas_sp.AAC.1
MQAWAPPPAPLQTGGQNAMQSDEERRVSEELRALSQHMKSERTLDWKAFQEQTANEMWEAWRKRKLFDAYRLARRAAGSKFGTTRRPYLAAQVAPPTEKERLDQLALPGSEGGMQATLTPSW